jgi:hypothetical protein
VFDLLELLHAPWRVQATCRKPEHQEVVATTLEHSNVPSGWKATTPTGREVRNRANAAFRLACRICLACPVRDDCLAQAVAYPPATGVWGGLSAPELRRRVGQQEDRRAPGRDPWSNLTPEQRSERARRIWETRKKRGGPTGNRPPEAVGNQVEK